MNPDFLYTIINRYYPGEKLGNYHQNMVRVKPLLRGNGEQVITLYGYNFSSKTATYESDIWSSLRAFKEYGSEVTA